MEIFYYMRNANVFEVRRQEEYLYLANIWQISGWIKFGREQILTSTERYIFVTILTTNHSLIHVSALLSIISIFSVTLYVCCRDIRASYAESCPTCFLLVWQIKTNTIIISNRNWYLEFVTSSMRTVGF